jgi:hypothetical protein
VAARVTAAVTAGLAAGVAACVAAAMAVMVLVHADDYRAASTEVAMLDVEAVAGAAALAGLSVAGTAAASSVSFFRATG